MIAVGIVSLLLGCFFLYVYQTKIKTQTARIPGRNAGVKLKSTAKLRRVQEKNRQLAAENLTLMDVRPGAIIHLENVGLRGDAFDAQVTGRHLHKQGAYRWLELEADRGGAKVFITVENDDGLAIDITVASSTLSALGLRSADLADLAETGGGCTISVDGTTYRLEEHGSAAFCRDHDELAAEPYAFWEFVAAGANGDGDALITITRWEDGSIDVDQSVSLDPSFVTIYSAS